MVVEPGDPGGQAGTSSLIRNYLGFRHGVSGEELADPAAEQAWLFGADFVLSQRDKTRCAGDGRVVHLTGSAVTARPSYWPRAWPRRRLNVPALEASSARVSLTARPEPKPRLCRPGCGGGRRWQPAGQAAVHLGLATRDLSPCLSEVPACGHHVELPHHRDWSNPVIAVRVRTEIVDGGDQAVWSILIVVDHTTGDASTIPATALFVLIGAQPHTEWLNGTVARDYRGYLLTGQLAAASSVTPVWSLERPPMLLETSVPGVFAAGDVRSRSVKRVASAVGEGATTVRLIHAYLAGE
jgi:thioredoxin reductase (NADPH)